MSSKKIIIILIVIALAAGAGYYFTRDKTPLENAAAPTTGNNDLKPDPSNATFNIEDETITLSQGKNSNSPIPGSALVEETELMDEFAYGDINADGKNDTVLLLARFGGGSGTFIYAAAYVSSPVNYKGTDAIFLGDRIAPQSISITNGVVTIKYLDRGADDPLSAEPTIPKTAEFIYRNGSFQDR